MYKTKHLTPILLMLAFSVASISAQITLPKPVSGNSGIVYGRNHAYSLTAPRDWVLDNKSGASQGLFAVFYPWGSSWQASDVVMYSNVWHKDDKSPDLQSIIGNDIRSYEERSPRTQGHRSSGHRHHGREKGDRQALHRQFIRCVRSDRLH